MKNYKMIEVVGDGTYGTVWRGIYIETGEKVAIKKLKNKVKSWQECVDMKEVKALSKLKTHPNVIKLKEIIRETNSDVFLIFEYADTNLYEYIEKVKRKGENLSEMRIKEIIYQIASGLAYTHQNGYFHRDLKPENILLMNVDGEEVGVKIADFGLARELPSYYNNSPLTDYVCTRWYRPPECILKSTNYSSAMDIWAMGCIMVEMYMLAPLFPGNSEFDQLTRVTNILGAPKFNDWPEGYKLSQKLGIKFNTNSAIHLSKLIPGASIQAINLLYDIFSWDPLRRPNCNKVLSHPYFEDLKSPSYTKSYSNGTPADPYSINSLNFNSNNSYYENYLNNFNYKTYKNHNSYIPEVNNFNTVNTNQTSNLLINNLNNNYQYNFNNNKSKLSYLAENDFKMNKFNKENTNKNPYTNNQYYFNNSAGKSDYYDFYSNSGSGTNSNSTTDSNININNGNFYYDIGSNRGQFATGLGNNQFKSDIENQISSMGTMGNGNYSKQSYFNFPQIFI